MAISKIRFREALNKFYTKDELFRLFKKYFLNWIAEGYIGSNLGLFEISKRFLSNIPIIYSLSTKFLAQPSEIKPILIIILSS